MNGGQKEDLVKYRFSKAIEALQDVNLLVNNEVWNLAVNRLYYSCYYAVSALLANNNMVAKSHAGTRQMFGLHFVKTGIIQKSTAEYYAKIFTFRHKGDYEDFVEFTKDDVLYLVPTAKDLINEIGKLLTTQTGIEFTVL
jgi:uncharacterized protein (UPF0332 family)